MDNKSHRSASSEESYAAEQSGNYTGCVFALLFCIDFCMAIALAHWHFYMGVILGFPLLLLAIYLVFSRENSQVDNKSHRSEGCKDSCAGVQSGHSSRFVFALLFCGLFGVAIAAGYSQVYMSGILSLPVMIVAIGLMFLAYIATMVKRRGAFWPQIANSALFMIGTLLLAYASVYLTILSAPGLRDQYLSTNIVRAPWRLASPMLTALLAAFLMAISLCYAAKWKWLQCLGLVLAIFSVAPLSILCLCFLKWLGLPMSP